MWRNIGNFLVENLSAIIDGITAIIALVVLLILHSASDALIPILFHWILIVLALLAVSGVADRLGFFSKMKKKLEDIKNTADAVQTTTGQIKADTFDINKKMAEGSFIKTYRDMDPLEDRLRGVHSIWLSGRFLTSTLGYYQDLLKHKINDEGCSIRILVIAPNGNIAQAENISNYGDQNLLGGIYKSDLFRSRLNALRENITPTLLDMLEVKMLDYSPRFDLLITNAENDDGVAQIQILTHFDNSASRPIIRLRKDDPNNNQWADRFIRQYIDLWGKAAPFV
jgi:hypothetical protein